MDNKTIKKNVKLYAKWFALAAFAALIIFLQKRFGKGVRESFCIFAGGVGMFVFGMDLISNTLQVIAGNKMRNIITVLTKNSFTAMLTGLAVSAAIQSSSAATVMVVGFVNAGLMTLEQAIGVILGANIGTTVTAQLIAFNLTDLAWPAMAVGSAVIFLGKKKKTKAAGEALVGFALLFLGMKFMSDSLMAYREHEAFKQLFISFSQNRFLGLTAGLLVTLLIQSSAATVGLTMSLAATNAFGPDPYTALLAAVPIILGNNIGTCITAILASIGTTRNARRAAIAHLTFNLGGSLLLLPFLEPFCKFIMSTSNESMRQIANAHSIFNIAAVCLFLPMVSLLKKLVLLVLPLKENEVSSVKKLDKRLLQTPPIAISQAETNLKEVIKMVSEKMNRLNEMIKKPDLLPDEVIEITSAESSVEKERDSVSKDLNQFLIYLTQKELGDDMRKEVTRYIYLEKDIEIIAGQLNKLLLLIEEQAESGTVLGSESREELYICLERIEGIFKELTSDKSVTTERLEDLSYEINSQSILNSEARENLMHRIKENKHTPFESVLLLDALRSVDSLLSSMKYVVNHLQFKF